MLLYVTLIACIAVFGWQVYRYDMKDREPVAALVLAAGLGAAAMWLAGLAQVAILREMGAFAVEYWTVSVSVLAGVTEEIAKLAAVVLVIGLRPKWFNDPLDGLVYGAFAGLGAAAEESMVILARQSTEFLPATEPVRLAGHLLMGGIGAFGLAYMKLGRRGWPGRLAAGFGAAVALHITWDLIAFDAADRGGLTAPHTVGSMIVMLGGMVIFRAMIRVAAGEKRGSGGRGFRLELEGAGARGRRATDHHPA
jgi:RsiW-degrading membrane proteinase PrsW (M82 family)